MICNKRLRVAVRSLFAPLWSATRSRAALEPNARSIAARRSSSCFLHITTREEMRFPGPAPMMSELRGDATSFDAGADYYVASGQRKPMNPRVLGPYHREAILRGLEQGWSMWLAPDHAPPTRSRRRPSHPGALRHDRGVQTLFPIIVDHVNAGGLSLQRLVDSPRRPASAVLMMRQGPHWLGRRDFTIVRHEAQRDDPGCLESPRARKLTPQ